MIGPPPPPVVMLLTTVTAIVLVEVLPAPSVMVKVTVYVPPVA